MHKMSLATSLILLTIAGLLTSCASTDPAAFQAAHQKKILLLGEVHDNPDGHRQRFEDLQKLVRAGWRPAIAMEQFDRENQAQLSLAQAECKDADCIIGKVGGKRWEWPYYRPVIQLALDYQLPLLAANLSRTDAARIMRESYAAVLDAVTIQTYQLDRDLPLALVEGQRAAMETGHCGKMPAEMVPGMVRAQVARDVWMAKVLAEHTSTGVVLLAGNGHVRRDLGVPHWLAIRQLPDTQVHGYVEAVSDGSKQSTPDNSYDVTHIVPPHARPDPCKTITEPQKTSS
ncbi:ChaN family lipoprotein [Undibacterium sp. Ji49W]|uniref:ChaN family lipoprotein n=1 Tax=Undibacterium sp. Ji49W TaxID=3413040 RepID=UPI003BF40A5F